MAVAASTRGSTNPSEVDEQKLVERPTTAFKQTEPLGAGVIFIRTPSCSKYLSCSATQIAAKAKLGTAVNMVTSGNSFCWARAWGIAPDTNMNPANVIIPTRNFARLTIAEFSFLLGLDLNMFGLGLPAQRSSFHGFGDFAQDDDHNHQHDDADEDVGGLKNSRRHANKKSDAFGGGDEFADDGADHGEGNACPNTGEYVWGDRRKNHFET